MEKVKFEQEAIVFLPAEREKLIECLNYCYHRMTDHFKLHSGLFKAGVTLSFVDYMRKNL